MLLKNRCVCVCGQVLCGNCTNSSNLGGVCRLPCPYEVNDGHIIFVYVGVFQHVTPCVQQDMCTGGRNNTLSN